MNKDKILQIAQECGFGPDYRAPNLFQGASHDRVIAFAQRIRQEALEYYANGTSYGDVIDSGNPDEPLKNGPAERALQSIKDFGKE